MTPGNMKSVFMEKILRRHYRRWWWQFWKPKCPVVLEWRSLSANVEDFSGFLVPPDHNPRR